MLDLEYTYIKDDNTGVSRLIAPPSHLVLSQNKVNLYYQGSACYTEGGVLIETKDVPAWFWAMARNCSEEMKVKVGIVFPEDIKLTAEEKHMAAVEEGNKEWVCHICDEKILLSGKVVHLMNHTKDTLIKKRKEGKGKVVLTQGSGGKAKGGD